MSLGSYQRPAFWKVPHYVSESSASPKEPMPGESTAQTTMICKPALISSGAAAPGGSVGGDGGGYGGGGGGAYAGSRRNSGIKKRVHFEDEVWPQVQCGSPSYGEVLRGDVISKIGEYDGRDLSHADAQHLFRSAGNEISLVVHRDSKIAYTQGISNESSRCNSTVPPAGSPDMLNQPHRAPSPFLPGPGHYDRAIQMPMDTLPHTVFPKLNQSGGYVAPPAGGSFSPMPTRDHQQEVAVEQAAIVNQPYRTTPLVLPGAKVKKDAPTTESYLRHYPNPAVRAHPGHDYHDSVMKQRVADTMLHRVVGQDADTGRVFHKQFNSPIGLYSEGNIENTIRQTVPFAATTECAPRVWTSPLHRPLPTKLDRYKNTLVYDPSKSETYRAIQEEGYGASTVPHEVTIPVQTKVFHPNRMVPGKKPVSAAAPVSGQYPSYNVVNSHDDAIRQSGSFNRLMYSVLGASEY